MKEIETLVEEKTKESLDVSRLTREGGPLLYDGIRLTMNSKVLNGSQRVVMDGVISDEECQELQRLTNAAATSGDGYRGQTSPHTPSEKFYGVTVFKALKLGQEGKGSSAERPPVLQRDGEGAPRHGVVLPPGYPALLLLLPPGVPHRHRRGTG